MGNGDKFRALRAVLLFCSFSYAATLLERNGPTISNAKTPPVTIKGNAFFVNDKRFYIRGLDYQPGGSAKASTYDPLATSVDACKRDVARFKSLGINTVRVYNIDNSANHDQCMQMLADAGIYLAVDVNTPGYSLNRENTWSIKASYNDVYLQSVFATIDVFAKYDNTLLFYSGNEVIDQDATTWAAPYIKAVVRDMKRYIKERGYRKIPVGYSAADITGSQYEMASYMNCGADANRGDFFAFNDYSWCSPDPYKGSVWEKKVQQYSSYSVPLFLSEYGCNRNTRTFDEMAALMSSDMTPVYSGGLLYEYSKEATKDGDFGLVDLSTNTEKPDFDAFKKALAKNPAPTGDGGYKASGSVSECPKYHEPNWLVKNTSLPLMPTNAEQYMKNGAGSPPGTKDTKGSQWAGTPTKGWSANEDGTTSSSSTTPKSDTKKSGAGSVSLKASRFLGVLPALASLLL